MRNPSARGSRTLKDSTEQDATHRALVLDELLAIAAQGTTVVLATHDPEVAERCDRVVELRALATSRRARRGR
ncbi:hypothetical protein ACWEPN_48590 [Nonomuraea wenchangensis]